MEISSYKVKELAKNLEPKYLVLLTELEELEKLKSFAYNPLVDSKIVGVERELKVIETKIENALIAIENAY